MYKIKLPFLLFLLFSNPITAQDLAILSAVAKHPMEYVAIIGETNINRFECRYTKIQDDQDIFMFRVDYSTLRKKPYIVYIPVNKFECNNNRMYNDFQSLLRAKEYPYIKIGIDPSQLRDIVNEPVTDIDISITIADVTNFQSISCSVEDISGSQVSISGQTTIRLPDFEIEPPVVLLGFVRVKEEVTISFSFNFIVS